MSYLARQSNGIAPNGRADSGQFDLSQGIFGFRISDLIVSLSKTRNALPGIS